MKNYVSLLLLMFVFLNLKAQNQQVLDEALKLKNSLDSYMKEQIGNTPLTDKEKWMFNQMDSLRKVNLQLTQKVKILDTLNMKKTILPETTPVHSLTLSIFFESNSAILDNKSKLYLNSIIKSLGAKPITLQAFTDAYGTAEYNKKLADARLKCLISYLEEAGYNGKIHTQDYNYNSNASGQNSSFNRRIDILL